MLGLFFVANIYTQTPVKTKDLITEHQEEWSEEFQAILKKPVFNDYQKSLDGKLIEIDLLVSELDSAVYIGGSICLKDYNWYYSIDPVFVELELKDSPTKFSCKKKSTITGVLKLNEEDVLRLDYILLDAEIVKER